MVPEMNITARPDLRARRGPEHAGGAALSAVSDAGQAAEERHARPGIPGPRVRGVASSPQESVPGLSLVTAFDSKFANSASGGWDPTPAWISPCAYNKASPPTS